MRHWNLERMPRRAAISGLVLLAFLLQGLAVWAQPVPEAVDDAELAARYAQQSLRVNVWVDKGANEVYARGETLQVTFQTNEDAYLVVYHVDVNGRVSVLWPTSRYNDGFAFGRHEYRLPAGDGARLRTADVEGVGYINALASRYPFDLRDLDVDFHHEPAAVARDFYVAGDPFLAMNEVNYAVTGMEDPSEYVVSNYTSYYVHRPVDHPRYLCSQCHQNDDYASQPYDSECTITIRYDYGWSNDWWDRYGYYPPYYYPVYVYVDPWSGSPWVNYWYSPWYHWPYSGWYHWDYACYDWHHSPYWYGDCDGAYKNGNRRYRPLDKTELARDGSSRGAVNSRSPRVTDEAPGDSRLTAMKDRTVVRDRDHLERRAEAREPNVVAGGESLRNVSPTPRSSSKFTRSEEPRSGAGLRIPAGRDPNLRRGDARGTGKSPARDGATTPSRSGGRETGARDGSRTGDDVRVIRPVEPREGTSSTWSGRRSTPSREANPARPAERPSSNTRSRVEKKSSSRGDAGGATVAPAPRSGGNSGRSSGDRGSSGGSSRGGSSGGSSGSGGGGDRGSSGGGGGRTRGGR